MNIVLIGMQGSGKDAVAAMLSQYHRITLADPIRHLVSTLHTQGLDSAYDESVGLLGAYAPSDLMEKLRFYSQIPRTTKNREILQGIGTYFRECRGDVWLNKAVSQIAKGGNVVTDVRYVTEFTAFKALGFRSIFIECPEDLRIQRLQSRDGGYNESSAKHKAESEIGSLKPLCDSVIVNDGTLEELRVAVDGVVAWLQFNESN